MYAIVDIAGKQFKVSKKDNILVPKVAAEVGKSVEFDKVLLVSDNGKVFVGQPTLKSATVKAKVLSLTLKRHERLPINSGCAILAGLLSSTLSIC